MTANERDRIINEYGEAFSDVSAWSEMTRKMNSQMVKDVKKVLLSKKVYHSFRFNSDHLDPITKIEVHRYGTWQINCDVELDRKKGTAEIKEYTNAGEVYSIRKKLDEGWIEEYFRHLEHTISQLRMRNENEYHKENPHYLFDDGNECGKVTWNSRDSIEFGPVFKYDAVDVQRIICDVKGIVKTELSTRL